MSTKIVRKYVEFFTFFPKKRAKFTDFGDFGKNFLPIPLVKGAEEETSPVPAARFIGCFSRKGRRGAKDAKGRKKKGRERI
jgi:hypothetical protein